MFQHFARVRYWLVVNLCSHFVFSVIPVKLEVVNSAYFQQESTEAHFIRRKSRRGGSVHGAFWFLPSSLLWQNDWSQVALNFTLVLHVSWEKTLFNQTRSMQFFSLCPSYAQLCNLQPIWIVLEAPCSIKASPDSCFGSLFVNFRSGCPRSLCV